MEEFKHVCRICKKRFPSGKSLGGHMRSHVIAEARKNKLLNLHNNNNNNNNKVSNFIVNDDDDEDDDEDDDVDVDEDDDHEINRNSGYGLRENPKKTWRVVNSNYNNYNISSNNNNNNHNVSINNNKNQEKLFKVCDQCGKGFNSMKALCGHMSIHSNNNNNNNNMSTDFRSTHFTNRSNNNKNNNKNEDDEDDNSWCSDSIDQLYLAMDSHSSDNINNNNSKRLTRSSVNGGGSSSNYSEIDQLEQEEVAMCLMMLSRDSSGSVNKINGNGFDFRVSESSDNNSVILEGGLKVGGVGIIKVGNKNQEMVNSDSGYFEYGAKELESDASVDGFSYKKFEFRSNEKRKFRDLGESNENYSSKKIRNDYFYSRNSNNNNNNSRKTVVAGGSKHECPICNKGFKTHQALGGHIISHRKNNENSFETSNNAATIKKGSASKKMKGHKCPYCPRVFKSGQALGGHKRSHMMGSNNVVYHSTPVVEPEPEFKQPLLDLNLPAPLEEESSGNSQFVTW